MGIRQLQSKYIFIPYNSKDKDGKHSGRTQRTKKTAEQFSNEYGRKQAPKIKTKGRQNNTHTDKLK